MDKKIKHSWIESLRSGRFEQGISELQGGKRYCCLGVLCRVAHAIDPVKYPIKVDVRGILLGGYLGAQPEIRMLLAGPGETAVGNSTGVAVEEPSLGDEGTRVQAEITLAAMNDGDGMPKAGFNEIADWIEGNIPEDDDHGTTEVDSGAEREVHGHSEGQAEAPKEVLPQGRGTPAGPGGEYEQDPEGQA